MGQLNCDNRPDGGAHVLARYTLDAAGYYSGQSPVKAHLKSYRVVDYMMSNTGSW
jgi:hypothetical protein